MATVHTLAENEGIMFDACLGLMLQVLNLLPQIPIDILFQTQIPLNRLLPGILHLHKIVPRAGQWSDHPSSRKSGHPTLCPKSWAELPTK